MRERIALGPIFAQAALPAACIALIAYFGFHAVAGTTGVLAYQDYAREHAALEQIASAKAAEKAQLQRQAALLDPRHVDPDLADELVRRNLNVVRPDEIIVPIDDK